MSVMNGFRTELTDKILGFNPHITIKPYTNSIKSRFLFRFKKRIQRFKIIKTFNGEAVIMMKT